MFTSVYDKNDPNAVEVIIWAVAWRTLVCILVFYLLKTALEFILLPGDQIQSVVPAHEAVLQVKAARITLGAAITSAAFFLAKHLGWKLR